MVNGDGETLRGCVGDGLRRRSQSLSLSGPVDRDPSPEAAFCFSSSEETFTSTPLAANVGSATADEAATSALPAAKTVEAATSALPAAGAADSATAAETGTTSACPGMLRSLSDEESSLLLLCCLKGPKMADPKTAGGVAPAMLFSTQPPPQPN